MCGGLCFGIDSAIISAGQAGRGRAVARRLGENSPGETAGFARGVAGLVRGGTFQ